MNPFSINFEEVPIIPKNYLENFFSWNDLLMVWDTYILINWHISEEKEHVNMEFFHITLPNFLSEIYPFPGNIRYVPNTHKYISKYQKRK